METDTHPIYQRFRKTILTSMILVPLIPFAISLGIGYTFFYSAVERSTVESMKRIVADHSRMIETFLEERKSDLILVSDGYTYEEIIREDVIENVFNRLKNKSMAFADLGIFDENGVHVAYRGSYPLAGKNYREAEWFKAVEEKGYHVSDVFLGYRQIPHFVIAVARRKNGSKWVIRATIDTMLFNELVRKVRIGKTGEAYILNQQNILQTERRSGGDLMREDPEKMQYPGIHGGIKTFIRENGSGKQHLYATAWLKDNQWLLAVRQEKSDSFQAIRSAAYFIVFVSVIGGCCIVAVAFYLTDRIIERLEQADREKGALREQLIRAGRLAELGEMAAGFAHEINNPLQIMKSEQALIEAILSEMKASGALSASENLAELEDSIYQIALQIGRCAKITRAILKFGRKTEPESVQIDLLQFIPEVIAMLEKKAEVHGVRIVRDISGETPAVFGDPSQLQQVLLNLLNNALDAVIQQHGAAGGSIRVSAGPHTDDLVEIRVTDNGSGIRPENMKKIFSPFFTTKPVGEGTGLGLSICYGIIRSMDGTMAVSSEPGKGTTFTVHLSAAGFPNGRKS